VQVKREYLGTLNQADPIYNILSHDVLPQLGVTTNGQRYRVFRLGGSNAVFEYEERESGHRVIGKFYGESGTRASPRAVDRMWREYRAVDHMRRVGLDGYPHHVMRALGTAPDQGAAIFLEHLRGETLGVVLDGVAREVRPPSALYERLTALAFFLATMHNRTVTDDLVDFHDDVRYLGLLSESLRHHRHMGDQSLREFGSLGDRWKRFGPMWEDHRVCLHGDATPANFLFTDGMWVGGIDFERSHYGDRVFDVGRIAGELQHAFMLNQGNRRGAEPYIGHFLWEYSCHFPDRDAAFAHICARVPFHLATTLLRVARNPWITNEYRTKLIEAARDALRSL